MVSALSIAAVERDTGLSKDTLRVWERRYGFPAPARGLRGERVYPADQVDRLRLLKKLLDGGHRPSKLMSLSTEDLLKLAASREPPLPATRSVEGAGDVERWVELVRRHEVEALRSELSQVLVRTGLAHFVVDIIAPLNARIGSAWARGTLRVFEEHLYTEAVQSLLRQAINGLPRSAGQPRILLTTLPQEQHGLGLLMAEAIFALEGCQVRSLGVQTPAIEIVQGVAVAPVDIVGLSFSSAMNPHQVLDSLRDLRRELPATVEIWAGGACPVLHRRPPEGIVAVRELQAIGPALHAWRARSPR